MGFYSSQMDQCSRVGSFSPKLSVIIPVYNVKDCIGRCLQSIFEQSFKELEIICVDDCSTDGSGVLLDRYSENGVVVVHLPVNRGVSYARNYGMQLARGRYVTFVDPDDTVNEKAFEVAMSEIVANGYDFVQYNYKKLFENGSLITPDEFSDRELIVEKVRFCEYFFFNKKISNAVWNKIFKKDLLANLKMDCNLQIGEDEKFIFDCLSISKSVKLLDYWGYNYYCRETSASNDGDCLKWLGLYKNGLYYFDRVDDKDKVFVDYRNIKWCIELLLKIPSKEKEVIKTLRAYLKDIDKAFFKNNSSVREKVQLFLSLHFLSIYKIFRSFRRPRRF